MRRQGSVISIYVHGQSFLKVHFGEHVHGQNPPASLRRLTKKPWVADEYLLSTLQRLITNRGSITKLIANSPNFKKLLHERARINRESPIDCQRIKDLNYAKNRFHSTQKPLGRFILTFDALLATASEIAIRRAGKEPAKAAIELLSTISEEDLLTIAMLADAGDEASAIVRFFDCESYDVADAPCIIAAFLQRIDGLFLKRGCLTVEGTYTKFTMDLLRRPHTIVIHHRNIIRSIGGGCHPEVVDRCLSRMAAWARLVVASIHAEFPSWEILNAFAAFNLKHQKSDFTRDSLCRLSAVFDCHADRLQSEFDDFRMFAQRRHAQGLDNLSAWTESIKKVDASSSIVKAAHPREELRAIVTRYALCMGSTTSGVERNFSSIVSVISKQRGGLTEGNKATDIKLKLLTSDIGVSDDAICQAAMKIWSNAFRCCRLSGDRRKPRWVSGWVSTCRLATRTAQISEHQWVKN
jgi:hypothetical protein